MSKRKLIMISVVCVVFGLSQVALAATTLKRLGRNPLNPTALTSIEDLRAAVQKYQSDLKDGFAKAGDADLYEAFAQQFPSAKVEEVKIQPGETLQWMLYKRKGKGKVRVIRDVTWAGAQPFDAYRFVIKKDNVLYEFIVPLVCTNLALKGSAPAPSVKKTPPPPPPPPPKVVPPRHWFPVIDLAYFRQFDPANYIGLRGGVEYKFNPTISVMALFGGLAKVQGDDGESQAVVDAILNFNVDRFFVGIGAGYRFGSDNNNVDLIADMGARVYGDPQAFNVSVFVEARIAVDQTDDISSFSRFGLGVRIKF